MDNPGIEDHVRDAVSDLVARKENTNNIGPNVLEMEACQAISLGDTVRPVATFNAKRGENGGMGACSQNTFLGKHPLERRETPFLNMGERYFHHLSLFSEGKRIP